MEIIPVFVLQRRRQQAKAMAKQCDHYTVRLSDPAEFEGLHFGEQLKSAAEKTENDNNDEVSSSRQRRSARHQATPTTGRTTRRRKRHDALRLSETSPIFQQELERIRRENKNAEVAGKLGKTTHSLVMCALVGAIQPNDVLESIHSLGRMKKYKCDTRVDIQDILSDSMNYPINLVFARKPEPNAPLSADVQQSPCKRKRTNKATKPAASPVIKEPVTISILSSDEEDDVVDVVESETPADVTVDYANDNEPSTDSAFLARPDPTPGHQANEWVLTPLGPGRVESYRIDRLADSFDTLANPILLYQVILPFGILFVSSRQIQPFEGSPYANETIFSSPKHPLTRGDLVRLQPQVYLNDNLVNCVIHHLQRHNAASTKVHVFSSYLYTRIANLSQGKKKNDPEFQSLLWNSLKGWIKNINIWKMNLLLIPIHDREHWSVMAVCHPGLLLENNNDSCIPCLLHLDSGKRFRLHPASTLCTRIRTFLSVCLKEQCNVQQKELTKEELPGHCPPVPAQANVWDCGLYMLEWIERLLDGGLLVTQELLVGAKTDMPPFGKKAFPLSVIDQKRLNLQALVYNLQRTGE